MKNDLIRDLKKYFIEQFGSSPIIVVAPGRINLIGEHTDYNKGFVLPAAVDRYMIFAMQVNQKNHHIINALDLTEEVHLSTDKFDKSEIGWANYFLGILNELKDQIRIKGINCLFTSNIPIGAGLSSSSAMECGFIKGICELHNFPISNLEIAKLSQRSNHNFLGVQGGIMDQFACVFGKKDHALHLDCQDLSHNQIPISLKDYQLVLLNTNVSHNHVTSNYNTRVDECRNAVDIISEKYPKVKSLRDVNELHLRAFKHKMNPTLFSRAKFVVEENRRVELFIKALQDLDYTLLGSILTMSHLGLQHLYEVSCRELDIMVDLAIPHEQILGARMMGGGFGGCTLNLIKRIGSDAVIDHIIAEYKAQTGIHPDAHYIELVHGLEVSY